MAGLCGGQWDFFCARLQWAPQNSIVDSGPRYDSFYNVLFSKKQEYHQCGNSRISSIILKWIGNSILPGEWTKFGREILFSGTWSGFANITGNIKTKWTTRKWRFQLWQTIAIPKVMMGKCQRYCFQWPPSHVTWLLLKAGRARGRKAARLGSVARSCGKKFTYSEPCARFSFIKSG